VSAAEVQQANELEEREFSLALIGAILAVIAWGSSGIVIRYIDMGGLAIAVYRFWIYAAVLVIWMYARGERLTMRTMRYSMYGGIALGLDVALFFSAVKNTTIVNATVISAPHPVIVGLIAWRFFGERIKLRDALLMSAALVAVIVVVTQGADSSGASLRGDLFAVGALFAWAAYFVFSRASREHVTPAEFTIGTAIWTGSINTVLAIAIGQDLSPPSGSDLAWILVLAFGAGVVGHSLMNWSLVRIPLWLGSTFTLLIPVTGSALAWIFLDEPLLAIQVLGIGVVLVALALLVIGQQSQPTQPLPPDS